MTRFFPVAVAALAVTGVCHALEPSQLFDKVSPSVWVVRAFDTSERLIATGSAVVIGPGRLVTNCHVLAKAHAVAVRRKNVTYEAKLEHADAPRDLCLLGVEGFSAPPVQIAAYEGIKIGQKVYAIGNPLGYEMTLSEGLISGLRGEWADGSHVIQTTAPLSHGSSGGGLFDSEGRLVGITTAGRNDAQNLNFALPARWIAEVPARAEAALAKRNEAAVKTVEGKLVLDAPLGYPAAGTVWVYRVTEHANHDRTSQVTVRADSVDRDFIEETVVLLGADVAPARRTVSTGEARFLQYSLGRESAFLELAPYLLAPTAGKAPAELTAVGYPNELNIRSGSPQASWISDVIEHAWEKVSVPAGTYRALHYEVRGKKDRRPPPGMNTVLTEYTVNVWYAPDIRRIVKLEHQAWSFNPVPYVDDRIELMEYRPPR